ncbi:MAG TPA: lipoate--protein ligase family protein [Verrucomicrobiae bacterium]|nr:lipoate--protein ligase family protein [Verrucomicrobiae bacterium]
MKYLDRTLDTAQENLACDEALLDECEEGRGGERLRFWEPRQPFVVLGYSNKARAEVNLDSCRALGVPVLRRCSGGGTVLQGPGCLDYALILRIRAGAAAGNIVEANAFIMNRNRNALEALLGGGVLIQGHTDLTLRGLKFSGNSQRRRRKFLLFHGTFLVGLDFALVEQTLRMPSKQPSYRRNRSHGEFMTNLSVAADAVKAAMKRAWGADEVSAEAPEERIARLVRDKYGTDAWNFKF